MPNYSVDNSVDSAIAGFSLPDAIGFGRTKAPVMYRADYVDGVWQPGILSAYGPIALDPAAKLLHYATEIFEGLKAYRAGEGRTNFFRPLDNHKRLVRSAQRMCMVEVPEDIFMDGIGLVTAYCEPFIPATSGESLYLRPFLIGTEGNLGLSVSNTFTFMVIASPSSAFHAGQMKVQIEREGCRAARGGTGAAKTGGNYAAALQSSRKVVGRGYDQSLWLDPVAMKYVEELSGMNLFFVMDGALHTPELTGSFLPGVTRDSIIQLARHRGIEVVERNIAIQEVLEGIGSGAVSEVFACGTAVIVSPVSLIADADGTEYKLDVVDALAGELRQALLAIQERRGNDPFGWVMEVDEKYYPARHFVNDC